MAELVGRRREREEVASQHSAGVGSWARRGRKSSSACHRLSFRLFLLGVRASTSQTHCYLDRHGSSFLCCAPPLHLCQHELLLACWRNKSFLFEIEDKLTWNWNHLKNKNFGEKPKSINLIGSQAWREKANRNGLI